LRKRIFIHKERVVRRLSPAAAAAEGTRPPPARSAEGVVAVADDRGCYSPRCKHTALAATAASILPPPVAAAVSRRRLQLQQCLFDFREQVIAGNTEKVGWAMQANAGGQVQPQQYSSRASEPLSSGRASCCCCCCAVFRRYSLLLLLLLLLLLCRQQQLWQQVCHPDTLLCCIQAVATCCCGAVLQEVVLCTATAGPECTGATLSDARPTPRHTEGRHHASIHDSSSLA
jgi:hypothetical protein